MKETIDISVEQQEMLLDLLQHHIVGVEALAESNLPFVVDLHVWSGLPERFREQIREEHAVLIEGSILPASRCSG